MKIATFNVNSIRRRLPIVLEWIDVHRPDVFCLQETKVEDASFPLLELSASGYYVVARGRKSYNGVATLAVRTPDTVQHGFTTALGDEDDRFLVTVFGDLTVINTYVPQGQKVGTDRYAYKLAWFGRVREYLETHMDPERPVIWLGDLNVAPQPMDVYHPDRRVNDPDFHIDTREAFQQTAAWGFTDVFRMLHPDRIQYTYWDYFRNALANNFGWRIDHILATAPLAAKCLRAEVDMAPRGIEGASDHTVVWAEFDMAL